jgi:hypothetical protein
MLRNGGKHETEIAWNIGLFVRFLKKFMFRAFSSG